MRSVRRGLVATALAFPLALGFAGVAGAAEGESSVDSASFEASFAAAGPEGAFAGEVSAEALHAEFEKNGKDDDKKHDDNGDKRDGDTRHDYDKGKDKDKDRDKDREKENGESGELDFAEFSESGAFAGPEGAFAFEIESAAFHAEKN
ncbi:hypothetical protein [Saccharomonospora cyanea]|uniref:Uncharacterized protein n=1 Tax=Saccharomonospora cyanea NA-134 TaxID=882082 RepID=H5XRC9_9PSEU|nr:hypothetical protein [Saccharomonospora cyanea]EHR63411.1 hypothetical protein SaccyDRAFT_4603 [Saccharomonospora cyanea NA-134]